MVEVWKSGHYLLQPYLWCKVFRFYLRFYQSNEARVRMFETQNCDAIDAIILMHFHKPESNFWVKRTWHLQFSFRMRSSQCALTLAILGSVLMIQWSNNAASCFGVWQLSWIGTFYCWHELLKTLCFTDDPIQRSLENNSEMGSEIGSPGVVPAVSGADVPDVGTSSQQGNAENQESNSTAYQTGSSRQKPSKSQRSSMTLVNNGEFHISSPFSPR